MKQRIFIFAAALLAAASCANKFDQAAPDEREIIITAYSDEGSSGKTTLHDGGTSVYWQPGDEVKLFYDGTGGRFQAQTETESRVSKFSGTLNVFFGFDEGFADDTPLWGLYPYRADATSDGESVTTTLPSEQTGKAGSFASRTYITLGKSTSLSMGFYAVCGGLRFSLTKEGVTKVIFEAANGEPIAGTFKTAFENGVPVVKEITDASSVITLTAPNSGTFEKDKWYYIVALPSTLANGFKIRLETDTQYAKMTSSSSVTFKRAKFGSIEDIDEGLIYKDKVEAVDLGLSVLWATCNLGADNPEEYGDYYQWAGLDDVTSTSIYLDWDNCPYHTGSNYSSGWTKYIPLYDPSYWSGSGSPDNKTVLDLDDDVAHVKLGDKWRMPTLEDWKELIDNCTWTWTSNYNGTGAAGMIVTSTKQGYTEKSIFLPAAGCRHLSALLYKGSEGVYLSTSLNTTYSSSADCLCYFKSGPFMAGFGRNEGCSVRPVYGEPEPIKATSLSLNEAQVSLSSNETIQLTATLTPSNCTETGLIWSSSNPLVAKVSSTGLVTALSAGASAITVSWAGDGTISAFCKVSVSGPIVIPEMIDLGLPSGLKWASFNLGATRIEEYGTYFQWGGLQDVTNVSIELSLENCPYHIGSSSSSGWTKYIPLSKPSYWSGSGNPDNKTVLDLEDDVAHVKLGDKWRMPTLEDWKELIDNCTWTWTSNYNGTGAAGVIGTSTKQGYTEKAIFLPSAGCRSGRNIPDGDFGGGRYWSSSLLSDVPSCAYCLEFHSEYVYMNFNYHRSMGFSVRPVCE